MPQAAMDRLMRMCEQHAGDIAELWYKALSENERTKAFTAQPKEAAIRYAVAIYKNMGKMYFAENAYKAVEHLLNVEGQVEDCYARGIPLEEVLYALILLRRHIWIKAENDALFELALNDMYEAVKGINRILLIFDYISYIAARRYRELSSKKGK
jgi:hypothetical protein